MRKIIVSEFVSLDGMMSDPDDTMKWVTGIDSRYSRCQTIER